MNTSDPENGSVTATVTTTDRPNPSSSGVGNVVLRGVTVDLETDVCQAPRGKPHLAAYRGRKVIRDD
jgi:hypothetical protein